MKVGKDLKGLLAEASQIDPMIGESLGDIESIQEGGDLTHMIADSCWNAAYDLHGEPLDQSVEIELDGWRWTRKGKPLMHEGRRIYGSREPGFVLSVFQEIERFPEGPREWSPKSPAMIYKFRLTVSREKGDKAMKKVAADLDWELVSG